jgi:hypothetical protein
LSSFKPAVRASETAGDDRCRWTPPAVVKAAGDLPRAGRESAITVYHSTPTDYRHLDALEEEAIFTSREEAEWEVFRRRWKAHTGENINLPYKGTE